VPFQRHSYLAVGKLAAAKVRNRFIATAWIHHAPVPRLRGLGGIALSPVADGGRRDASPRQVLLDGSRSSRPSATAAPPRQRADRGSGTNREAGPAPDSTLLPDLASLCAWPAARTSAIMRTDLTDLTRLSLQPSAWRVPVGWVSAGVVCAVRRLVLGSARAGDRAA
jgi:hypothetical protein